MLKVLEEYQKAKKSLGPTLDKLKGYLQDDTKDLEDRWAIYKAIEDELGEYSCYLDIPRLPDFGEVGWYDDLHCERYQTIAGTTIVMMLGVGYHDAPPSLRDIEIVKETILQSGAGAWVYDW